MQKILGDRFAVFGNPAQQGGHSVLYKASDLHREGQQVAVKIFSPRSRALDDRVLHAAWSSELRAYQAFGVHPNLVRLIDWGRAEDDEAPYLVFEWLSSDLEAMLPKLGIEGWDDFWPILEGVLTGLALIHEAGYVHRDIKPENVLIGDDSSWRVADFGTTRLIETINMGQTMAPLGTIPYAPPELGTVAPSPAYDIYSFGVLCIRCLSGSIFRSRAEALSALSALDLPAKVSDILTSCIEESPEQRPESASTLLAQFREFQRFQERAREPEVETFFATTAPAIEALERQLGLAPGAGIDFVRADLAALTALGLDQRASAAREPDLEVVGQTLLLRCQPHRTIPGVLLVHRIYRPPATVLERAHSAWWRPRMKARFTRPTNSGRAANDLAALMSEVAERTSARVAAEEANAQVTAFAGWRHLLDAKFAVERERGSEIRYRSYERAGSRVRFRIDNLPQLEQGEGRLIRNGARRVLKGEVEGVENDELVLYVTGGNAQDLPRTGALEYDSEASKSKLKREQNALDRILSGKAIRPDLRELLVDPATSRPAQDVPIKQFKQKGLDEAKQVAVRRTLGSPDFTIVQGPPGTGKTTYIAEVVAQYLDRDPNARIVLTSQTHIALDNALVRIGDLLPDVAMVRLGPAERLTQEVEALGLARQMDRWKERVAVEGRSFIRAYAGALGITPGEADLKGLASDLRRRKDQLHDLRSRISLRRVERKEVADQLERLNASAPEVLAAAESLEAAASASGAPDLAAAAQSFVEIGLKLAARLESADPLSERLLALESSLAEWQEEVRDHVTAQAQLAADLSSALGRQSGDLDELIGIAEERSQPDPRLARLEEIAQEWQERFGASSDFNAALILKSSVVAATCVGLTGVPGLEQVPFDLCIVDEASKATATETLVPLAASAKWVLVGDDRQLPPFVEHALEQRELLERFELDPIEVKQTLFTALAERLPEESKIVLTQQHRMHPTIGRLVSNCFYGGTLTSVDRAVSPVTQLALQSPVVWLDTSQRPGRGEQTVGKSVKNRTEATLIAKLLNRLDWVSKQRGEHLSVAVLTGYDAQRREIVDAVVVGELDRQNLSVRVATVDAYQGQEADVAIFSLTRSNDRQELGFLNSTERINVALSRARDALVIVGDASFVTGAKGPNPLEAVLSHIRRDQECLVEVAS